MSSATYRGDAVALSRLPPTAQEKSFQNFLLNRRAGTFLGRTPLSWALIGLFYLVFYAFLAGFFSLLLFVFAMTIDLDSPKYVGEESLLRNPGLSYRPQMPYYYDDLRPTISYSPEDQGSGIPYIESIDKFLMPYEHPIPGAIDCAPDTKVPPGSVCHFDLENLTTSCSKANNWGYETNSPCLILKLNKMFSWTPHPLPSPESLPEGLQHHLSNLTDPQTVLQENVLVWCESEDVEFEQLSPVLPSAFFPYAKQKGYLSPFVFVRVLEIPAEKKVKIRCRAWASNIPHQIDNRLTGEMVIYFELF